VNISEFLKVPQSVDVRIASLIFRSSDRPQNAPAGQNKQTKLLYQDSGRGERGKRQTKLLYQGNCAPKSLFSRKDRGAGRGWV